MSRFIVIRKDRNLDQILRLVQSDVFRQAIAGSQTELVTLTVP